MFDVLVTEDFAFRAEVDEYAQVNLHMEVSNWNKSVAKQVKKLFKDVKEGFRLEGFSHLYTITPNPKFAKLLDGWEDRGGLDVDGKPHQVIVWELEV